MRFTVRGGTVSGWHPKKVLVDLDIFVNYTREFSILFLGVSVHAVGNMVGQMHYHLRVGCGAEFGSGYSV